MNNHCTSGRLIDVKHEALSPLCDDFENRQSFRNWIFDRGEKSACELCNPIKRLKLCALGLYLCFQSDVFPSSLWNGTFLAHLLALAWLFQSMSDDFVTMGAFSAGDERERVRRAKCFEYFKHRKHGNLFVQQFSIYFIYRQKDVQQTKSGIWTW